MPHAIIRSILHRELRTLQREVAAYPDDASLWTTAPGISNSAGTLVLHLTGNLQHFIGEVLGRTGYARDREAEFARRGLARAELLAEIEDTIQVIDRVLEQLAPEQLGDDYPISVAGHTLRTLDFLLHLVSHLAYHLGQLDYHRRMVSKERGSIGAVAVTELPSSSQG